MRGDDEQQKREDEGIKEAPRGAERVLTAVATGKVRVCSHVLLVGLADQLTMHACMMDRWRGLRTACLFGKIFWWRGV